MKPILRPEGPAVAAAPARATGSAGHGPPRPGLVRRWLSPRALGLHLAILVWAPGCVAAGWWQADVAMSGNTLSYLYAVEWPVFALFGLVVWWNLVHDDPALRGVRGTRLVRARAGTPAAPSMVRRVEEEDAELAGYNEYLATLAERGPGTWRRP